MTKTKPTGWEAVHALALEKIAEQGWTFEEFYARSGISETTFRKMANGVGLKRTDKLAGFEDGMEWERGTALLVAAGGEPSPLPEIHGHSSSVDYSPLISEALEDARRRDDALEHLARMATETSRHLAELLELARSSRDRMDRFESYIAWREAVLRQGEDDPSR